MRLRHLTTLFLNQLDRWLHSLAGFILSQADKVEHLAEAAKQNDGLAAPPETITRRPYADDPPAHWLERVRQGAPELFAAIQHEAIEDTFTAGSAEESVEEIDLLNQELEDVAQKEDVANKPKAPVRKSIDKLPTSTKSTRRLRSVRLRPSPTPRVSGNEPLVSTPLQKPVLETTSPSNPVSITEPASPASEQTVQSEVDRAIPLPVKEEEIQRPLPTNPSHIDTESQINKTKELPTNKKETASTLSGQPVAPLPGPTKEQIDPASEQAIKATPDQLMLEHFRDKSEPSSSPMAYPAASERGVGRKYLGTSDEVLDPSKGIKSSLDPLSPQPPTPLANLPDIAQAVPAPRTSPLPQTTSLTLQRTQSPHVFEQVTQQSNESPETLELQTYRREPSPQRRNSFTRQTDHEGSLSEGTGGRSKGAVKSLWPSLLEQQKPSSFPVKHRASEIQLAGTSNQQDSDNRWPTLPDTEPSETEQREMLLRSWQRRQRLDLEQRGNEWNE